MAVFLDFAKAFDSLDRNVLFAKLEYYGIKGVALNWFKSRAGQYLNTLYLNHGVLNSRSYRPSVAQ